MIIFALAIMPDLEDHRTQPITTPSDGTKLLRVVILLIDQISLIEYPLCLFETDAVFTLNIQIFAFFKVEARI